MRIEEDFQRFREMTPGELKAELLTSFEMIPAHEAKGSNDNRASSELRFKLLGRVCRILERSSFSLAGREYFEEKRLFDLWVTGLDTSQPLGARFSRILDAVRDPLFDLTELEHTKTVERAAFIDLSMQLLEVRTNKVSGYVRKRERKEEIEKLEGLLERWPSGFHSRYGEEIV